MHHRRHAKNAIITVSEIHSPTSRVLGSKPPYQTQSSPRSSIASPILDLAPRSLDRTVNLPATLRHSAPHFTRQHIPEAGESLSLPAQILITALNELDELACVDVWVSGRVDVVNYLWWELDAGKGGVGGVCFRLEVLGLRGLGVCRKG